MQEIIMEKLDENEILSFRSVELWPSQGEYSTVGYPLRALWALVAWGKHTARIALVFLKSLRLFATP
ncbi:hypothetical protein WMY93_032527, partial [Mugilogobius chulae]